LLLDSHVSLLGHQHTDNDDKIDFGGGNVHVITSKENWDQKIEEANKDGKIVSKTNSRS
jgi:thioredoxin 1